jgi:glycosyltransferase involved in cell wall biosynthesis
MHTISSSRLGARSGINVAAYTPGIVDASARVRVRQFIVPLADRGIIVTEHPSRYGSSPPERKILAPLWATATIGSRLASLAKGRSADVSWILRQLLPGYLPVQLLARKPIVLDVDDAIWLTRGGHRVAGLARSAHIVVCGNEYLAERFSVWNSNTVVIPTAIDTKSYSPGNAAADGGDGVVIGWTGSSGNFAYLYAVEDALKYVLDRHRDTKVLVIADREPAFRKLPQSRVEFIRWTPAEGQKAIARMSIGIMPLEDSEWARGKCSYKMLCYMASCLPVVVSAVGMNNEVLAQGEIGYGASSTDEWIEALTRLIEDPALRVRMGVDGRRVVELHYSLDGSTDRYTDVFRAVTK